MRILVVDDYPPLAKVIAIGLRRAGHEVERAGSVRRALEIEGRLDVAVIDVDLPDGSGIDVAQTLLSTGRARRVVFFSATRDPEARLEALRLGPLVDKNAGVEALFEVVAAQPEVPDQLARAVGAADEVLLRASGRSGTRKRVR